MLPTEDKTTVYLHESIGLNYFPDGITKVNHQVKAQHLYATVELIKAGDWFLFENKIFKCIGVKDDHIIIRGKRGLSHHKMHCRKIIATTDPKLTKSSNWVKADVQGHWECENCGEWTELIGDRSCKCKPIPQLQQSFLKEFVANPDGEYEVEYERVYRQHGSVVKFKAPIITQTMHERGKSWEQLKLNQDNEVNITSVKTTMSIHILEGVYNTHVEILDGIIVVKPTSTEEKMYSLEQMELSFRAGQTYQRKFQESEDTYSKFSGFQKPNEGIGFKDWIKENL